MIEGIKHIFVYWYYYFQMKRGKIDILVVPKKYRDYNLCIAAVSNNGYILQCVPIKHRDYDMCFTVVSNDIHAIWFVLDKELKTIIAKRLNLEI